MGVDDGHGTLWNGSAELLLLKAPINGPSHAAVMTVLVAHEECRPFGLPMTETALPKHVGEVSADHYVVEKLFGDGDGQDRIDDLRECGERPKEKAEEKRP